MKNKKLSLLCLMIVLHHIDGVHGQTCEEQYNKCSKDLNQIEQETIQFQEECQETLLKLNWEMSYAQFPSSCTDLKARGFAISDDYLLDFDGYQGEEAAKAYCNFQDEIITMGQAVQSEVDQCESEGCFAMHLSYDSINQLKKMIEVSEKCQQTITFHCSRARINHQGHFYLSWRDVNLISHYVKGDNYTCNRLYDSKEMDTIVIEDKRLLPISSVYYGPLHSWQSAMLEVGPVICSFREPITPRACVEGWVPFKNSCYLFTSKPVKGIKEARKFCSERNSKLVDVETEEENAFIIQILSTIREPWWYLIGLKFVQQEGIWRWSSGKPLDWIATWAKPIALTTYCASYIKDDNVWKFNAIHCDIATAYVICEI